MINSLWVRWTTGRLLLGRLTVCRRVNHNTYVNSAFHPSDV